MLTDRVHGLEALLRYKENGATVKFVGKDTQKGLDLWIIDLTDKENNSTRYYVSAKTGRVLWFHRIRRGSGDLREADQAGETLAALFPTFPAVA